MFCDILASKDLPIDFSQTIVEYWIMALYQEAFHDTRPPAPSYEVHTPVVTVTHEITLEQGEPVSLNITRDNIESPLFVKESISFGRRKLAEIVGPVRWNALVEQAKSDKTPEETAAFVNTLLTTPVSDGVQITEWSRHGWRVSRNRADRAFVMAETGYRRGAMREAQAGFAQHLDGFILGFPEGERNMKALFRAFSEVGTSGDWEEKPNLAREVANVYWDIGERVLESWTAQPVRQN